MLNHELTVAKLLVVMKQEQKKSFTSTFFVFIFVGSHLCCVTSAQRSWPIFPPIPSSFSLSVCMSDDFLQHGMGSQIEAIHTQLWPH